MEELVSQRTLIIGEFVYKRTLLLLDQEQLSCKLMEKLTAVQRSATTEQLRVQTERVTTLNADMKSKLDMFESVRSAADLQAKGEYEGIQGLFTGEASVHGSVTNKQLLVQPDEGPDLELPEYEGIMSPEEMMKRTIKVESTKKTKKTKILRCHQQI